MFYEVLEVGSKASHEELRSSYRRLLLRDHPDHGGSDEAFVRLQSAYRVLSDPAARSAYDASLRPGVIWCDVRYDDLRDEDGGKVFDCRCGSVYYVDARHQQIVPCDGCSLTIRVLV